MGIKRGFSKKNWRCPARYPLSPFRWCHSQLFQSWLELETERQKYGHYGGQLILVLCTVLQSLHSYYCTSTEYSWNTVSTESTQLESPKISHYSSTQVLESPLSSTEYHLLREVQYSKYSNIYSQYSGTCYNYSVHATYIHVYGLWPPFQMYSYHQKDYHQILVHLSWWLSWLLTGCFVALRIPSN